MKRNMLRLITLLLVLAPLLSMSQGSVGDVIEKAMKDELDRSMNELKVDDENPPFFISYTVTDGYVFNASATLGALTQSRRSPRRNNFVRVMVGDYDFNDESISLPGSYDEDDRSRYISIPMPIENDYYGIRRSLWKNTDGIYKSAVEAFKKNQTYLKENKDDEELTYRRLIKTPVTHTIVEEKEPEINEERFENLVKKLSALFESDSQYENSIVTLSHYYNTTYFLNSEGTSFRIPSQSAALIIYAKTELESGKPLAEQVVKYFNSAEEIPDFDVLKKEVDQLKEKIEKLKNTEELEESYSGPVLFVDGAVSGVLRKSLFGFSESLVDKKVIKQKGQRPGKDLSSKIGKKVISDMFTVKATPKRKTFEGKKLLGSFQVDAEGVVPPDELTLIENGILKTLLNDRTTSKEDHIPNGHNRGGNNASPGVIEITSNKTTSMSTLKEKLIQMAKEEGLDFAVMIKDISTRGYNKVNFYKVSLEDGHEEFMKSASISTIKMKSLKNVVMTSDEMQANNASVSRGGTVGSSISIIAPSGLLMEDLDLEPSNSGYFEKKETLVPNPINE